MWLNKARPVPVCVCVFHNSSIILNILNQRPPVHTWVLINNTNGFFNCIGTGNNFQSGCNESSNALITVLLWWLMAHTEMEDKVWLGGHWGKVIKHSLLTQSPACPSQSALVRLRLSNQPCRFHTGGFFFPISARWVFFKSGAHGKQAAVKAGPWLLKDA